MFERYSRNLILEALADTRVVYLLGPRQVGKTTLATSIAHSEHPARLISLDDDATREVVEADPAGFVAGLRESVVIDEVQRVPALLLAIKRSVDRDTSPGRFLLTGSANIFSSRKIKDALTGRIEIIRMWPLAQAEIKGSQTNFVDLLFAAAPPQINNAPAGRKAFVKPAVEGGYPEARTRSGKRRNAWFSSYVDTTLDHDLRDISDALKLRSLPQLLRLLANQAANLLVHSTIAEKLDLAEQTVKSYVELLETAFLVKTLPAWRPGLGPREYHTSKAYVVDSGLLAFLLSADERRVETDPQVTGKILENFVAMEVLKHSEWATADCRLYHYRDGRDEIDLVLESRSGEVVAIEVKAAASFASSELRSMEKLRDRCGDKFCCGILLYTGEQTLPISDRLWAVPLSGLWTD